MGILSEIRSKSTTVPGAQHVLGILDNFEHVGPNGKRACLVFKAMGPDMGPDMSKFRRVFPGSRIAVPLMKSISKQLLLSLAFLHDTCRVIHSG